jgi:hypothetical protein
MQNIYDMNVITNTKCRQITQSTIHTNIFRTKLCPTLFHSKLNYYICKKIALGIVQVSNKPRERREERKENMEEKKKWGEEEESEEEGRVRMGSRRGRGGE